MKILRNQKGYTLTELMVVVAIVGVLAALAVPTYLSYLPHLRLNSSARDIFSYMRTARAQAAVKGRVITLQFNLAVYPNPDSFTILDNGTQIASTITLPAGVNIAYLGVTANNNGVFTETFNPDGSMTNNLSVFICSIVTGIDCMNGGGERPLITISAPTAFPTITTPGW
ncbi:MAG: prepilin-type N-terminal cleavage/methylation domain-containing protein [Nitrospirae bacterium]|nr:prepilin-type N-terminal cleavage/methylation domain-containing protein [Nitrospirota bacterium]